jgi:predicted component of type VI protein secretion system
LKRTVAVPLVLRNHEAHQAVVAWRAGRDLSLCGHAWIEAYAVLTRLPGPARVSPSDAARVLASNFAAPVTVAADTWATAVQILATEGIAGGASYDGWVALAARDSGALLASRDARAEATYRRLGVDVEMVTGRPSSQIWEKSSAATRS